MGHYYPGREPPVSFVDQVGQCVCSECGVFFWPCDDYDIDEDGCPDCGEEVVQLRWCGLSLEVERGLRRKILDYACSMDVSPWDVLERIKIVFDRFAQKTTDQWLVVSKELEDTLNKSDGCEFVEGPWGTKKEV